MEYEQISIFDSVCPMGGDTVNDCADCVYSNDYHCVNGECVLRHPNDPATVHLEPPKEVHR